MKIFLPEIYYAKLRNNITKEYSQKSSNLIKTQYLKVICMKTF
jgi:hypothetical protein